MSEMYTMLERASLQGAIALLVVWLLCRLLHRLPASFRCWLWRLAFLKCLVGLFLVLTVAVPILPHAPPEIPAAVTPSVEPVRVESAPMAEATPAAMTTSTTRAEPVSAPPPILEATPVELSEVPSPWKSLPFWLTLLYSLGVSAGLGFLLVSGVRTRQLVRRAKTIEHPALKELGSRFGRRSLPCVARSPEVASPLLAFNTILLPTEPTDDEPLMLGHELAHFHRRDLAWEWLGIITQIVFWFHPLVWLARREERMTREQAADALAIAVTAAPPADYARALLAASLRRNGRIPTLAVGAIEGGSRLRQRLEALTHPKLSRRIIITFSSVAIAVSLIAFVPWKAVARQQETPVVPDKTKKMRDMWPPLRARFIVRYPDGTPAPGMSVRLVSMTRRPGDEYRWGSAVAKTNVSGECLIQREFYRRGSYQFYSPGTYQVLVTSPQNDYIGPDRNTIDLSLDRNKNFKEITLVRAAKIIGQVTDNLGQPVREIGLTGNDVYWGDTDSQGRYTMAVPPGKVLVTPGYGYGSKTVLARVDQPTSLNFTFRPGIGAVRGNISNSKGNPVSAQFRIQGKEMNDSFATQEPGQFYWQPRYYVPDTSTAFAYTKTEGAVFTVRPGQDKPYRVQLSPRKTGFIQFRLTDEANNPIRNAIITATTNASFDVTRKPDADGNYRIIVQPDVTHSLRISATDYHEQYLSVRPKDHKITVRGGETKDFGHIVLKPVYPSKPTAPIDEQTKIATRSDLNRQYTVFKPSANGFRLIAQLAGTVTNSLGKPIPHAKVSWAMPRTIVEATTDEKGKFTFSDVTYSPQLGPLPNPDTDHWKNLKAGASVMLGGEWNYLIVQAEGYGMGVQPIGYRKPGIPYSVTLTPPKTYTAAFRDTKGNPIVGLPVWVEWIINDNSIFRLEGFGYSGRTDERGEFHANNLPPSESIRFGFDQNSWTVAEQDLANQYLITKNERTVYTLDKGHSVEGTVRFPNGQPAADVYVHAVPPSRSSRRTGTDTKTDAQGHYRLVGLGATTYKVWVTAKDKPGTAPPGSLTIDLSKSPTTVQKDLTFALGARVVGKVTDGDGKPLARVNVSNGANQTSTDRNGRYTLPVGAGETTLTIEGRYPKTIQVHPDRPTTLNFTLPKVVYGRVR